MISEPSVAEIQIAEALEEFETTIATTLITVSDARKIGDAGYKVLMKCEELRKSRENWRKKYEELKEKCKESVKELRKDLFKLFGYQTGGTMGEIDEAFKKRFGKGLLNG